MIRIAALSTALLLSACAGDAPVAQTDAAPDTVAVAEKTAEAPAAEKGEQEPALTEMSMDDVEAKMASGDCTVVDANSAATREANGVLDGAVLIDNYRTYDFASLGAPKDASLVFYCGSTLCTASDKAATRAMAAGYTDVQVMREGIKGWKKAGKKTVEWTAPKTEETKG